MKGWTAILPVRAGSKGLPSKNIKILIDRPLYQHTIDHALASGASQIIISTDIPEIINSSFAGNVHVVSRPTELCGDAVPMAPVLLHALKVMRVKGLVALLQVTSPLRNVTDIQSAIELADSGKFDLVMSVTPADSSVLKWGEVLDSGEYKPISRIEYCFSNRQSLPTIYKPNGAIYAMSAKWFVDNGDFETNNIGTIVMPLERSYDIDTVHDFELCESILKRKI